MKQQSWIWSLAFGACASLAPYAAAQAPTNSFNVPGPASWNVAANWTSVDGSFVPGDGFPAEVAEISNGGVAFLDAAAQELIDSLVLANGAASGTLEIRPGGSLTVVDADPNGAGPGREGAVQIGTAGAGTLFVNGGTLNAGSLSSGGAAASLLRAEGASTFNITGDANLNRVTRIRGNSVNFNVGGDVNISGSFEPVITGAAHSAIKAPSGTASVAGNLAVSFDGVTPAFGNSWTLIDASDASGAFASVTSNTALPRGLALNATVDAGNSGNVGITVGNRLVLTVNRDSGAMALNNAAGAAIAFDGYVIQSPSGWLSPGNGSWSSLDDQNVGAFAEANPTANALSELTPTGSTSLAVGASRNLGNAFNFTPAAFGVTPDELVFTYTRPTGEIESGIVEYTGDVNNLLLQVDPATGIGRIEMQSAFNVAIDSYSIRSASGSLTPGTWNSLDDQNIAGWAEANPTVNALSELLPVGGDSLVDGDLFNLGAIFSTTGTRDLSLEFSLADGTVFQGIVQYGALTAPGLNGDTNGDGSVDLDDLNAVRNNFGAAGPVGSTPGDAFPFDGQVDLDDLNAVRNNFGAGGSNSVPEPSALALASLAIASFGAYRWRRGR
jgi:hypothetical protein